MVGSGTMSLVIKTKIMFFIFGMTVKYEHWKTTMSIKQEWYQKLYVLLQKLLFVL